MVDKFSVRILKLFVRLPSIVKLSYLFYLYDQLLSRVLIKLIKTQAYYVANNAAKTYILGNRTKEICNRDSVEVIEKRIGTHRPMSVIE